MEEKVPREIRSKREKTIVDSKEIGLWEGRVSLAQGG